MSFWMKNIPDLQLYVLCWSAAQQVLCESFTQQRHQLEPGDQPNKLSAIVRLGGDGKTAVIRFPQHFNQRVQPLNFSQCHHWSLHHVAKRIVLHVNRIAVFLVPKETRFQSSASGWQQSCPNRIKEWWKTRLENSTWIEYTVYDSHKILSAICKIFELKKPW